MALFSALVAALAAGLLLGPGPRLAEPALPDGSRPGAAARRRPQPQALQLSASVGALLAVLLIVPAPVGPPLSVLVGAVVWWRSRSWESAAARRRQARLEEDLPHVVDLMVAALAAGAAPGEALARVGAVLDPPTSDELSGWVSRLRLGADPVSVWTAMARHPQLGRLGVALRRSAESGAPVTAALTRLAEELRARRRADVEARVRQVEVRAAVPLGVCLLPSFVLVGVVPLVAGSVLGFLAR